MMHLLPRRASVLQTLRMSRRCLSSSSDSVLVNLSPQGTAEVTLNRPSVHNAMSEEVIQALRNAFEALSKEDRLRAIFLKANGKNFSAGADLQYMKRQANASRADNEADAFALSSMFNAIATSHVPTVALVNGAAFGGALGLIAACDIAVGCRSSKFCFSEVKLGLIPATIGPFVLQRIGPSQARRFFLTAEVFEAQKALDIGLLHEVVEGPEQMEAFGKQLEASFLQNSPCAMSGSKKLIQGLISHGSSITDEVRQFSAEMLAQQRETAEAKEGIAAFLEKRKPSYNTSQ